MIYLNKEKIVFGDEVIDEHSFIDLIKGGKIMFFWKKKKYKYPEIAKYKLGDYVNFRYRNELLFGYIYEAKVVDNEVLYTIQLGGQCPSFINDYKEKDIIGLKIR